MDVQKKFVTKTIEETKIIITLSPEDARLLLVVLDYIVDNQPPELSGTYFQVTEFQKRLKEELD